jgi:DeoR family glycerol-3-phosphate regulon repressor
LAYSFRHEEIIALARRDGRVTVDDLVARLEVAPQTIRRDLTELCNANILTRVHGGAVLASRLANIGYTARRKIAETEKDQIGELCAAAIPNDCSMFINIGTTTEAVAKALRSHKNIMAITNNLNVANTLVENEHCEVIVAGGVLRRSDGGLVGEATGDFVRQFKVDFAIIGASALDEEGGMFDFDYREVRVAQAIIRNARQTYLVADHSKFSRTAPVRIGRLSELHGFFTDRPPPVSIENLCVSAGIQLSVGTGPHDV